MELTVVIPTHGGADRLPATLEALARARRPPGGLEVLVVDDGSPHPFSLDRRGEPPLDMRMIRLDRNRGRAAACNAGLAEARGRVVLVLDDDMSVADDTLAGHAGAHGGDGPPRAVIGRIEPDPAFFRGRFGRFLAEEEQERRSRLLARPDDVSFENCLTGHFSVPRRVMREAGGYEERFSRYGFEDIELGWRLHRGGVRLGYRDDLVTRHRSEHASFVVHCRRHREAGAMAAVFAASSDDPRVRAYLRLDVDDDRSPTFFRRLMAAGYRIGRSGPRPLRGLWLAAGRGAVTVLALLAPRRLLHGAYHVVRGMHYAAGLADAEGPEGA